MLLVLIFVKDKDLFDIRFLELLVKTPTMAKDHIRLGSILPAHSRDLPAHSRDLSVHSRDLPAHSRDLPVHSRDLPAHSRDLPAHGRDLPASS